MIGPSGAPSVDVSGVIGGGLGGRRVSCIQGCLLDFQVGLALGSRETGGGFGAPLVTVASIPFFHASPNASFVCMCVCVCVYCYVLGCKYVMQMQMQMQPRLPRNRIGATQVACCLFVGWLEGVRCSPGDDFLHSRALEA